MQHVKGARGNKISFANFSTSKIKKGVHIISPVWAWENDGSFLLENMVLNEMGVQKNEPTTQEKTKFRYTLSDGRNKVQVYAHEKEMIKKTEYELFNRTSILNGFEVLQAYNCLVFRSYRYNGQLSGKLTIKVLPVLTVDDTVILML